MATKMLTKPNVVRAFPLAEVKQRLEQELREAAEEATVFRAEWEPLLDSIRMVAAVQTLEDLFPGVKLPPDRLVKRGGCWSVEEGVNDILGRVRNFWDSRNKSKGG
jgi:hypothetical protein